MTAPAPPTLNLRIRSPIARKDLPGLCARVCALLESGGGAPVDCDVGGIDVDAVTIDALSRLQLAAIRYGCRIRLRNASPELLALVAFMGLHDALIG